jgi:hypothetical protein
MLECPWEAHSLYRFDNVFRDKTARIKFWVAVDCERSERGEGCLEDGEDGIDIRNGHYIQDAEVWTKLCKGTAEGAWITEG